MGSGEHALQEGGQGSHAPVATLAHVAFGQKAVQASPSRYGLLLPGTHAVHDALAFWPWPTEGW